MIPQPTLTTARLSLRAFAAADAPELRRLAGQRLVADTTISIPHPYPAGEAERAIARFASEFVEGKGVHFAITLRGDGSLIGAIGLRDISAEHSAAELGFWITPSCQGRGYASEAVPAVVAYGFDGLGLNRVYAHHMTRNPASGRVLEKAGFRREGLHRQAVCKWGVYEDVVAMALLFDDWRGAAWSAKPRRPSGPPGHERTS